MKIDILTLFPDVCDNFLSESIIGRAREKGIIEINFINIRDFSKDKHKKVDDTPYGGGMGMVMGPDPIYEAYLSVKQENSITIFMSPKGKVFNQQMAINLSKEEHLIIICGHYEGVDQRLIDEIVDMEISIGDFVLTGGEIAAITVADAVSRLIDGVLSDETCFTEESHFNGLLEYPQYTRPYEWHGKKVPDVLISGHHENINKWRKEQSLRITNSNRPDMIKKANLSNEDIKFLESLKIK